MKQHIQQLAEEYAKDLDIDIEVAGNLTTEQLNACAVLDFTAGINRVLQHPEEFGLQTKEY